MIAHVGGLPLEESIAQLAPLLAAAAVAARLVGVRLRAWRPSGPGVRAVGAALGLVLVALAWSAVAAANGPGGGATITASFSDGCREFTAQSSRLISHVKLRYADGREVKDSRIKQPDYSIDGAAGDELDSATVKSGTTTQTFICPSSNGPPTATLEIKTPALDNCRWFPFPEYPTCLAADPRTAWSRPAGGTVAFIFIAPFPAASVSFRGVSSTDPDGDIASWSIDFGDGASASGSWSSEPPVELTHTYASPFFGPGFPVVTLTVTDAAGQSDSDTIRLIAIDGSPD